MEHADHVRLIEAGVVAGIWADLGSGRGAFTLALADCLQDSASHIHSVDIDRRALTVQETRMTAEFPQQGISYHHADFTHMLDLPPLDGILMANALHFVRDKASVVTALVDWLKPEGRLLLVEYDTAQGNYAVPHPLTFAQWTQLAQQCGFVQTKLLATRPSRFLGSFFSALSFKQASD